MFNKLLLVVFLVPGSAHTANWLSWGCTEVKHLSEKDKQTGKTNVICPFQGPSIKVGEGTGEFIEIVSAHIAQKEKRVALLKQKQEKEVALEERKKKKREEEKEKFEKNGVFICDDVGFSSNETSTDYGAPSSVNREEAAAVVSALHRSTKEFSEQLKIDLRDFRTWISKITSE